MKINLLIEFFESDNLDRNNEYVKCLEQNINNNNIDYIHIFNNKNKFINNLSQNNSKIISINYEKRMRYCDFMAYSNKNLTNEFSVISNLDIIFDDTIDFLKKNYI
jgi:hypothetical protein